jgi:UDP-N-acetylglucosamine--N-acetylmuramyl-(pentapeptide) pyrophosphoryl-undecaprenol N-acetylglucosamine transferase
MNVTTSLETLWVGGQGGMETALVKRAGIPFNAIPAAGLHGVGLRNLPRNLRLLGRGYQNSRQIVREFKPQALFFTGGFVAAPMALAGRKVPSLVYVPDIEPGLALRTIGRFARRIAVSADASRSYFPDGAPIVVTGYPVRPGFGLHGKAAAREALGVEPAGPVLLVFGGSKGARSINTAVLQHLDRLLELAQVIHITGEVDWPTMDNRRGRLGPKAGRYHARAYLHEEMPLAFAAADLALSRAGASSLGEFPAAGLPAVLVPYPHAWRYQKVNADYLASRAAAVVLEDERLPDNLLPLIEDLLRDPDRLAAMSAAMRGLARPEAASAIATELLQMAEGSSWSA